MAHDTGVPASPKPGWYPDPAGSPDLRWWDGAQWLNRTQPVNWAGPAPAPGAAPGMAGPGPGLAASGPAPATGGTATATAAPPSAGPAPGTPGPSAWAADSPAAFGHPGPAGPVPPIMATAPGAIPPAPAPAAGAPVPWAWAVAASPLLLLAGACVVAAVGGSTGSTFGYIALGAVFAGLVGLFLAYRDARALKITGNLRGTGIAWWALLAPWAYLWARAARRPGRTNLDWIVLAASVAMWFLIVAISAPVVGNVATAATTFNRAKVQTDIARGIRSQLGVSVVVDCPKDPPIHPGSAFQCIARATDGSRALVTVTIQDRSGDYTWHTS